MPDCPYCDDTFLKEDELLTHILKVHPEKTLTAESYGKALEKAMGVGQIYHVAAYLTSASVGREGASVEETLERFKFFIRALYPLFFGKGESGASG